MTVTLTINDGPEGGSIEGIPEDVWARFMERAKKQFPKEGQNAWSACLSEVIFSIAGGSRETITTFMTDIPVENHDTLEKLLQQTGFTWDKFHAYLLNAAMQPGSVRVINFPDKPEKFGTVIITGIRPHVFPNIQAQTGMSVENLMAAIVNAADSGKIGLTGDIPKNAEPD